LQLDGDGALYDADEQRLVTLAELRDEVRNGRRFRAFRHDTGADCTYEVLANILHAAFPDGTESGVASWAPLLRLMGGGFADVMNAPADSPGASSVGTRGHPRP
jgi:polyhydroxyalkanoate synthesis regulator protein